MSLNKIILVGRVTRDPELRYTSNGKPVAKFGLAVDRPRVGGGDKETDFFDIVVWQKTAEFASKWATKGRLVAVDGRVEIRDYETQDGQKKRAWEVIANDLRLLDSGKQGGQGGGGGYSEGGYEAPAREPAYSGAPAPDHGPGDMSVDDIPF